MLDKSTLPQYRLTRQQNYCGGSQPIAGGDGCGAFALGGDDTTATPYFDMGVAFASSDMAAGGVVVEQASIGPYDYAVLKADDETAMLQWLSDNRYFVPAGTSDAAKPYIHPGAYFLALKLRGGETTGDIAPIVLKYASDLPMIPITLTQVGAVENMGVLVWVAGEARAIPRNYYHVVLDDLPVWFSNFTTYNLEMINAVHEAPGKHGFITQYAGSSSLVVGQLDYPGRFGDLGDAARADDAVGLSALPVGAQLPLRRDAGVDPVALHPRAAARSSTWAFRCCSSIRATTATRSTCPAPTPTAASWRRSIRALPPTRSPRAS